MGHRRNRKRDRRSDTVPKPINLGRGADPDLDWMALAGRDRDSLAAMAREFQGRPTPPKSCGGCREFVEDQEGGRGTCLHPGSGVLSPWTDTAACQFYMVQRGIGVRH
jgi:hypothetical protein